MNLAKTNPSDVTTRAYAIAVLDEATPDMVVAAKNASPLVVGLGDGENFLASDIPAILAHTREMVFLGEGEMVVLEPAGVTFVHIDTGARFEPKSQTITWSSTMAEKGGFKNVEFREGQIESLPVKDGEVDTIISNCVINLSPDKLRVFLEAFRVLKPGGRIFVSDIVLERHLPWFVRQSSAMYSACIAGALLEPEYLGAIKAAGFEGITIGTRAVYSVDNLVADPGVGRLTRFLLTIPYFRTMASGVVSLGVSAAKPVD